MFWLFYIIYKIRPFYNDHLPWGEGKVSIVESWKFWGGDISLLNVLNLINQYTTRKKILLNIISPAFVVIEKIIVKISKYLLFETAHHRCLTTFSNYLNLNCNPDQLFPGTSLKNGKFIWKRCVHDFEYWLFQITSHLSFRFFKE